MKRVDNMTPVSEEAPPPCFGHRRAGIVSRARSSISLLGALLALCCAQASPAESTQASACASNPHANSCPQVRVPNRPSTAIFKGTQQPQQMQITYDPASHDVTVSMLVQDPQGYFIPNIRRDNFAVYEDGVRQHNATVEVDRAPVTVGILVEDGGHYRMLNDAIGEAVSNATTEFLDEVGRQDRVALWVYSDRVKELSGFTEGHDMLQQSAEQLNASPPLSESNLYDALTDALGRMQSIKGRKALLLMSSGLDTFSNASLKEALHAAAQSQVPIYVIDTQAILRSTVLLGSGDTPYARLDWAGAARALEQIAKLSGGRLYEPSSTLDLPAMYDDLMENLRVRYVVTYRSTSKKPIEQPRKVRVELVDSRTGRPLRIVDESGQAVRARITVENEYVPAKALIAVKPPA